MGQDSCNWRSFWDLATPGEARDVLLEIYGVRQARQAAVENAQLACCDDRAEDQRFWLAVLCQLYGIDLDAYFGPIRPVQSRPARS